MSEEAAAKLRLRPRKAPAAGSREPSPGREPPRRRQTLADRCSWFEEDDLNECEKTWILLLKNISQDLQCTDWQTVPSFPEFSAQSSKEESLQEQEVFTIGMRDFQWVSFPSFGKEEHLNPKDLSSHQLTQSQIDHSQKGWDQADKLRSLPSTAEKTSSVTITDQAKNMVGEDTEDISKLDSSHINSHSTEVLHTTWHCHKALQKLLALKSPAQGLYRAARKTEKKMTGKSFKQKHSKGMCHLVRPDMCLQRSSLLL
ncbi:Fanconi anemia core complex-associated protein 20-like [Falco naumanni]|uniref:Fanconi anemia core complex-associated protein 20-like n=1 Tax=Falco naumanni TaxID=148594 RepID=UPI001ADE4991|nr:Fanconi anemia core complex-associated protein 20-like [Falco naumanni]